MNAHTQNFHIAATHPALPGHFPGQRLVPGVVLLDRVVAAIEKITGQRVTGLPQVKFLRPLLPEQQAQLEIVDNTTNIRFRILHAGSMIASGGLELAP